MSDSAFTPRTRYRRAGCIQRCPSGSGGGGWIPLVTGGWPPTSCARRLAASTHRPLSATGRSIVVEDGAEAPVPGEQGVAAFAAQVQVEGAVCEDPVQDGHVHQVGA